MTTRALHLRSWVDAEGYAWADMCGCALDEDHDVEFPEHTMTRPVGRWGEEWETFPCLCDLGSDHDSDGRFL